METKQTNQFGEQAVFAFYDTRHHAEHTIETLKGQGFGREEISIVIPSAESSPELSGEPEKQIPKGAAAGAGVGAIIGVGIGWLVGLGAFAIPGLAPFVAAGPILGAFAGASTGGSIGGLTGAMIGLGLPEHRAEKFAGLVKEGRILLSVHVNDAARCEEARRILEQTEGQDIFSTVGMIDSDHQKLVESNLQRNENLSSDISLEDSH